MATTTELLRKIQDGAVSDETPVSELLRRCQVLAARLGVPELATWVRYELDGYPDEAELPPYRIKAGIAMGHFVGPFGSGVRNAILPANNLPPEHRQWAQTAHFRQPIAALEQVAQNGKEEAIRCAWPGNLVSLVQENFYENMALAQAWLSVSRADLVGAVETVRNRILTFTLEAESLVNPDGAEPSAQASGALSQVFHTIVYGNVSNLAQASTNVTQSAGFAVGDFEGLVRELSALGVGAAEIEELRDAVTSDSTPPSGKFGGRVTGWLGGMIAKTISGAWGVATTTATTVLPKLLERYYGIPG